MSDPNFLSYKQLNGLLAGKIMMVGNSGTGKTTVMKALRA